MIKFFRKIRQNLLMENKTGKYFKYAIGEIVLVVIGILIALQINNWNGRRHEQKSLEKDLDILMYEMSVVFQQRKNYGQIRLHDFIKISNEFPYNDDDDFMNVDIPYIGRLWMHQYHEENMVNLIDLNKLSKFHPDIKENIRQLKEDSRLTINRQNDNYLYRETFNKNHLIENSSWYDNYVKNNFQINKEINQQLNKSAFHKNALVQFKQDLIDNSYGLFNTSKLELDILTSFHIKTKGINHSELDSLYKKLKLKKLIPIKCSDQLQKPDDLIAYIYLRNNTPKTITINGLDQESKKIRTISLPSLKSILIPYLFIDLNTSSENNIAGIEVIKNENCSEKYLVSSFSYIIIE